MENKKVELTKGMQEKVSAIEVAKANVRTVSADIVESQEVAQVALSALEAELADKKEEKASATDIVLAKKVAKEVAEIEENIELQLGVNEAVLTQKKVDLDEALTELLNATKSARFFFTAVEAEYKATVSLRSLKEDTATLQAFASTVNQATSYAVQSLVKFGFIEQKDTSSSYKGVHLGSSPCHSRLETVFTPDARRGY
ncbi:hypothetical protein KM918_25075 [Priestia megaterium]|uniref:hypothetical protein n=1 Tax=Priestia megaterium TaxID=1404 RepID=UPI001C24C8D7|nr:hypothetical protein [Priestia megaterium]MBU8690573.1 hypothetical protein [Priestia megaterium]